MSDYFEEVADMMASSFLVGRWNSRETILAALRAKFPTEDALRAYVAETMAQAEGAIAKAEQGGKKVVGVAQAGDVLLFGKDKKQ